MSKRLLSILVLISAIALVAIIVLLAVSFLYLRKTNKPTAAPSTEGAVNINTKKSYPKIETYNVPILMYHYIRDVDENEDELGYNLSVSPANFESQVKWLKDNNFVSVKLSDLADTERIALSKIYGEEQKPIVLTFDDGYDDAYINVFPVLKKYGFTATFFIISAYTDKKSGYLTEEQIDELKKSGMEIGSHTLTHPDLTDLDASEARNQITLSKEDSLVFCYPAGQYDTTIKKMVETAGYVAAVTTKSGIASETSDLWALPRVRMTNLTITEFAKKFTGI